MMSVIQRIFFGLVVLTWALCTTGCATVVVEAAKKTMEDRVTGDQLTDTQISAGVMSSMSEKDKGLLIDVNVDTWEQRVLLTGTVTDNRVRQEVVRAATADKRARKIYDELQVVSQAEQDKRREAYKKGTSNEKEGTERAVSDFWIETKISAQLIAKSGVTSVNYRWRCVRGTIYIIGRSRNVTELNTVLDIVRNTDGVRLVKHFIEVKPR